MKIIDIKTQFKKDLEKWFFSLLHEEEMHEHTRNQLFALGEKLKNSGQFSPNCGHIATAILTQNLIEKVESGESAESAFSKVWDSWKC